MQEEIERLQRENASLKKQLAEWKSYANGVSACIRRFNREYGQFLKDYNQFVEEVGAEMDE